MFNVEARSKIRLISQFLDSCGFCCASARLVPGDSAFAFPSFAELQTTLKSASEFHRFLFSVFRQGHRASEVAARSFLPRDVFEALIETGLLVRDAWAELRTPNVALASVQGLKVVVSLPAYPTATDHSQPIYFGPDSVLLASSLPAHARGLDVLDVGCGSGFHALVCAARGARKVVGLEVSPLAVNAARFNAALNDLDDIVDVRQSDVYSALAPDERFDFIVSSPPSLPMVSEGAGSRALDGGADGAAVSSVILAELGVRGKPAFSAVIACSAIGDAHRIFANADLKSFALRDGYHVDAVVTNKQRVEEYKTESLEPALRACSVRLKPEERSRLSAEWARQMEARGAHWVYYQTLMISRPTERPGVSHVPTYRAVSTDRLVSLVQLHRASA